MPDTAAIGREHRAGYHFKLLVGECPICPGDEGNVPQEILDLEPLSKPRLRALDTLRAQRSQE